MSISKFSNTLKMFQKFSDITLVTEDGYMVKSHKILLVKASKYFEVLFCGSFKQSNQTLVPIKRDILQQIVLYIMQKEDILTVDNVSDILLAADYLIMDELVTNCKNFIFNDGCTVSSCLEIYNTACMIEMRDVKAKCKRFIEIYAGEVFTSQKFSIVDLPFEVFKEILECDNLNITDEALVWNIMISWIKGNYSNRITHFYELLKYIRLQEIDESKIELLHVVANPDEFKLCLKRVIEEAKKISWLRGPRVPQKIYFICKQARENETELYVTFDERLDYCCFLGILPKVFCMNSCNICIAGQFVYFSFYSYPTWMKCFDLLSETWIHISKVPQRLISYSVVSANGNIYALGGRTYSIEEEDEENGSDEANSLDEESDYSVEDDIFNEELWEDQSELNDDLTIEEDMVDNEESSEEWTDNMDEDDRFNEELWEDLIDETDDPTTEDDVLNEESSADWTSELEEEEESFDDDEDEYMDVVDFYEIANHEQDGLDSDFSDMETEEVDWLEVLNEMVSIVNTVQRYNRETDSWHRMSPMSPVKILNAVVISSNIFVIGVTADFEEQVCQVYDTSKDIWTIIPNPKNFRSNFCAASTLDGNLYLIGGQDKNFNDIKNAEEYNPNENLWRTLPDLPYVFYNPEAIIVGGKLIVFDKGRTKLWIENRLQKNQNSVFWDREKNIWGDASFINDRLLMEMGLCHIVPIDNVDFLRELIAKHKRVRSVWKRSVLTDLDFCTLNTNY